MKSLPRGFALAVLGAAVLAFPLPARAKEWRKIEEYQVIDAVSLWITPEETKSDPNEFKLQSFPEHAAKELRLAWIDSARAGANRPVPKFLDLPLSYVEIRQEWLRWIRQVSDISEAAKKAFEDFLVSKKDKLRYRIVPEAAPYRRSRSAHGALWVELEAGGTDASRYLVREGWAIPFLSPGTREPGDWGSRLGAMQGAMSACKGMWKRILAQCREK